MYAVATGLIGFPSAALRVRVTRLEPPYAWVTTADLLDRGTPLTLDSAQLRFEESVYKIELDFWAETRQEVQEWVNIYAPHCLLADFRNEYDLPAPVSVMTLVGPEQSIRMAVTVYCGGDQGQMEDLMVEAEKLV